MGGGRKKEKRAAVLSAGCPLEEEEGLGVIRPSRSLQKKKKRVLIDIYIFLGDFLVLQFHFLLCDFLKRGSARMIG